MTDFENSLEKMKIILGVKNDFDVADAIGMKPSAFANRKKSGSTPFSHYMKIIKSLNVNLNWFVYDKGPIYINDTSISVSEKSNPKDKEILIIEHGNLVKEFEDQERAKRINHNLIKIEKKNKQAFRDMDNYIEGIANGLDYSNQNNPGEKHALKDQKKTS